MAESTQHSSDPGASASHHEGLHALEQRVWAHVSHNPIASMWNLQGVSIKEVAKRTWKGIDDDNLFGRASQLAYSFFSAIFPALIAMSSIMGLIAKSSGHLYVLLLHKIGALIPPSAFQLVLQTFQSTTSASTGSKVIVGLVVALFSASTGVAAVQDTLNTVYRVRETRPFWRSRLEAAGITVLVAAIVIFATLTLFSGDIAANWLAHRFFGSYFLSVLVRVTGWILASLLMVLSFEALYYLCPDVKNKRWRWFTPGGMVGLLGWVIGSLALRIYLHWFGDYSATYGTLGAVIILLLWFYVTGVMILLGGEVNSEIEHAVAERVVLQRSPDPAVGAD